jgi:hypothetical protein
LDDRAASPCGLRTPFATQKAAMMKSIKTELALFAAGFMAVAPLVAICLGLALVLKG